jgi:hypothetical protein
MQLLHRTVGAQIGIKKEPQRGDVIIAMIIMYRPATYAIVT